MFCPACRSANPDGTRFCRACGRPLPQTPLRTLGVAVLGIGTATLLASLVLYTLSGRQEVAGAPAFGSVILLLIGGYLVLPIHWQGRIADSSPTMDSDLWDSDRTSGSDSYSDSSSGSGVSEIHFKDR